VVGASSPRASRLGAASGVACDRVRLWRIVPRIDGRQIATGHAAQPALRERKLVWALEHHEIEVGIGHLIGGDLLDAVGPAERLCSAAPVSAPTWQDGDEVVALYECQHPRAVHMPAKQVHHAPSCMP
jgi:hypothetical protein